METNISEKAASMLTKIKEAPHVLYTLFDNANGNGKGAVLGLLKKLNCPTDPLFGLIVREVKGDTLAQQRITAHMRERLGVAAIPLFKGTAESAEKLTVALDCIEAIWLRNKKDAEPYRNLAGSIPSGQAETEPEKPEPKKEEPKEENPEVEKKDEKPKVKASPEIQALANNLAAIIMPVLREQFKPEAQLDVAQVQQIVRSVFKEQTTDLRAQISGALTDARAKYDQQIEKINDDANAAVKAYLAKVPPRDTVEIKRWDGTFEVNGKTHRQLKDVLTACTARRFHDQQPTPIYLHGAPGAGKTKMGEQISQALNVRFFPYTCSQTDTGSKIVGYRNLATGEYVNGIAREPYEKGGLLWLGEVDNTDPGVLVSAHDLIENCHYTFPDCVTVKRHRDFYIIADANTIGLGATAGFQRNKLDAATRSRWAFIKIDYDLDLERALVPSQFHKWVDYVVKVRQYVSAHCKDTVYITPRASFNGVALLNNGCRPELVADAVLFTGISDTIKNNITSNVGTFTP